MPDANITKSALANSMKRLMKEKPFSKISVVDICEGCGMNRKSFYYHFKDKYDLVNWVFYTDFISLVSRSSYSDGWELLTSVGELFYQDQEFYRAALKVEGQNSFWEYFQESMTTIVSYFMQDILEDSNDTEGGEVLAAFFCDAFLSAIVRWLEKGCRQTPEQLIGHVKTMIVALAESITKKDGKRIKTTEDR